MQAVVLLDSNPTPIRAGETLNLHTLDGSKDVLASMLRIQEGNFTLVTLVIKIVVHSRTFQFVKKKIV